MCGAPNDRGHPGELSARGRIGHHPRATAAIHGGDGCDQEARTCHQNVEPLALYIVMPPKCRAVSLNIVILPGAMAVKRVKLLNALQTDLLQVNGHCDSIDSIDL